MVNLIHIPPSGQQLDWKIELQSALNTASPRGFIMCCYFSFSACFKISPLEVEVRNKLAGENIKQTPFRNAKYWLLCVLPAVVKDNAA